MPMWRCPHCATPQPEAARCWVCKRSSTCCATCRHFRNSVAAQIGFCGLDRSRAPLTGDEIRACWLAGERPAANGDDEPVRAVETRTPVRLRRDFVPVEPAPARTTATVVTGRDRPARADRDGPAPAGRGGPELAGGPMPLLAAPTVAPGAAWSLFPELEDLR